MDLDPGLTQSATVVAWRQQPQKLLAFRWYRRVPVDRARVRSTRPDEGCICDAAPG